jgi:hypothetical protein
LFKNLTVGLVPLTAEEEVFWCLFCAATAVWAVHFADAMKEGFVVAMSNFELVESTCDLPFCPHGNNELLSGFPSKLCGVCAWIALDSCWGGANKSS